MCRIRIRHYYDPELKRTVIDGRYACDIYEEVNGHVMKLKTFINKDYRKLMRFVHREIIYLDYERHDLSVWGYMKWIYKYKRLCLKG